MTRDEKEGAQILGFVLAALVIASALALIVAPIVAHLAWDVFVRFWNVV